MRIAMLQAVAVIVLVATATVSAEDTPEWVFITADMVELREDGKVVGVVSRASMVEVLKRDSDRLRVEWRSRQGWIDCSHTVNFDHAMEHFNEAVASDATAANLVARGKVAMFAGVRQDAVVDFEKAIRIDPEIAEAHFFLGSLQHASGRYDKAFEEYNEAIRLDPKYAVAYGNRAQLWRKQGETQHAISDLTMRFQLEGQNAVDLVERAMLWEELGESKKSLGDLAAASQLNPEITQMMMMWHGSERAKQGDRKKAINVFDLALRLDPKNLNALAWRASLRAEEGDFNGAITDFDTAIALKPNDAELYAQRGMARTHLDKYKTGSGLADFNKAVQIDPKNAQGHTGIASVLIFSPDPKLRDGDKAVEHAKKACELVGWKKAGYLATLAAAYAEAGRFDKANEWIQKAIDLDPQDDDGDRNKMKARFRTGQPWRFESE